MDVEGHLVHPTWYAPLGLPHRHSVLEAEHAGLCSFSTAPMV